LLPDEGVVPTLNGTLFMPKPEELTEEQIEYADSLLKSIHKMSKEEQNQAVNSLIEMTGMPKHFVQSQIKRVLYHRTFKWKSKQFLGWLMFPSIMFTIWIIPSKYRAFKEVIRDFVERR
jgi:hypothetical protein